MTGLNHGKTSSPTNETIDSEIQLEFKKNAARLVNEKGYTHQQAADHLDISINVIGRWSRAERSPVRSSSEENNFKLDGSN